ncbi:heparin lyase I family protein [Aureimonas leprariae]|uniref:heparin lyase I family protein n=1 Tax=Plantimonas leprariae TaxID=2615207 RepID=UPI00138757A2|nr:heparin lyase I family protein [Aureimonas leprariae]
MGDAAIGAPTISYTSVTIDDATDLFVLTAAGRAQPQSTVSLFIDGVLAGQATTNPDGVYSADLPFDEMGSHKIVATIENGDFGTASSPVRTFTVGTANDTGARDWGDFTVVSNEETFRTLNAHKDWSISAPESDSLRFEVRNNDVAFWDLQNKAASERSEARLLDEFSNDVPFEVSYKMNIEPGEKNDAAWVVLGQLHQNDHDGALKSPPAVEIGLRDGDRMAVFVRYTGTDGKPYSQQVFADTTDIQRGHDYDMSIRTVLDPDGNGRLVITRDGATIVDYSGKINLEGHTGAYWQEGIYRHAGATVAMAVEYKDLAIKSGGEMPPAPQAAAVKPVAVHLSEMIGLDGLTLHAIQSVVETAKAAPTATLHWQASADGANWIDIVGASAALGSSDALAGQFVRSAGTYTDAAGVHTVASDEILRFGGAADDTLNGLQGDDVLVGLGGNDTLAGWNGNDRIHGGEGQDALSGGLGDDRLIGDGGNDMLDGGAGDDALFGGSGNDKLVGGDGSDDMWGGGDDDALYGFAGDDDLHGDAGNDFLHGGDGNDVLRGGAGDDRLEGMVGNDKLFGDAGDDFMVAGDGADQLDGGSGNDWLDGGAGADRLASGTGNDTYVVDDAADIVKEVDNAIGGGRDSVFASVSYKLTGFVETLNLTGAGNIDGTGNALANRINGNDGNNVITGLGGADILRGGRGADTFTFLNAEAGSQDRVLDFSAIEGDKVAVDHAFFGLAAGQPLDATRFVAGAEANQGTADAIGQFIFNTSTHVLSWDADGAGSGKAVALARFDDAVLHSTDIIVI